MKNQRRLAVAGLILTLPAVILVSCGLLGINVPAALVNPLLVMGGLMGAFLLGLLGILRLHIEHAPTGELAAVNVRIEARPWNLTVVGVSVALTATILAYLFVENFAPR